MSRYLLRLDGVCTHYDQIPMLMDVSINIEKSKVTCVLGANGAGKTTLLKAILGIVKADKGFVLLDDEDINPWPTHKRVERGLAVASAASGTFAKMSVENNLKLGGCYINDKKELHRRLDEIYQSFPILKERAHQKAGTLSGGERTILTLARAVLNKPRVLLLDEPSLGLAPIMIEEAFAVIRRLNKDEGMTILLVEQNVGKALEVADYGYVIQKGQIVFNGDKEKLAASPYAANPVS